MRRIAFVISGLLCVAVAFVAAAQVADTREGLIAEIVTLLISLNERGVTIILIEHIMRAVMQFSERVAVLVAGKKIADGDPRSIIANPEVQKAYLGE